MNNRVKVLSNKSPDFLTEDINKFLSELEGAKDIQYTFDTKLCAAKGVYNSENVEALHTVFIAYTIE